MHIYILGCYSVSVQCKFCSLNVYQKYNNIADDYISPEASLLKLFTRKVIKKNEVLGHGSYGCVEVVLWHGKEYAAKRLRTGGINEQERKRFYQQFRTEYNLLSSLSHNNIVAYVGLCFLSHSDQADVPLLMMDRMKIDLHKRLVDFSQDYSSPLTVKEKFFILLGVTKGLHYLHTHNPPVIHRDLTARNVLLDENGTAKISDFGNSRILSVDQSFCIESVTCIPGTIVYSAPEALPVKSNTRYSSKIDIFSFGHLTLFVFIDEYPYDLPHPVVISQDGERKALTEVERREKYMNKLKRKTDECHIPHIFDITMKCLDNLPSNRPCAKDILTSFEQ